VDTTRTCRRWAVVSVHPIAQLGCAAHTVLRFTVVCCSDISM
jgi:hypothetical protein